MDNQTPENNNVFEETPINETPVTEASESDKISVSKEEVINAVKDPNKTFGIISLVCGILAQLCCCCCGGASIPFSIAAIVLAIVDKSKNGKFSGLGIAGLVLGIAGILLFVVSFVLNASTSILNSMMSEF